MTFIVKPLVTEKMTKLTDKSSVAKTYKVKGRNKVWLHRASGGKQTSDQEGD